MAYGIVNVPGVNGQGAGGGKSLASAEVKLVQSSFTYDGQEKWQKVESVKLNGALLVEGRDYLILGDTATEAGTHHVIIFGIVAYSGSASAQWSIAKANGSVSVEPQSVTVSGVAGTQQTVTLRHVGDGTIHAVCNEPQVVTVEVGSDKLTLTSKAEGSSTVTVTLDAGTNYTGSTCTLNVQVKFVSSTLEDNSWETIALVSERGEANQHWQIGDKKDGYQILGFDHDDLDPTDAKYSDGNYNGGKKKAGITFQAVDILDTSYSMNTSNTNSGGWESCQMRKTHIPAIRAAMNQEIVKVMRKVTKKTTKGGQSTSIQQTADDLFLLSLHEVFKDQTGGGYVSEGETYAYYSAGNSAIKNQKGQPAIWWLRSPDAGYASTFHVVNTSGSNNANSAGDSYGVAAGFCV